jgi:hypothetical protein
MITGHPRKKIATMSAAGSFAGIKALAATVKTHTHRTITSRSNEFGWDSLVCIAGPSFQATSDRHTFGELSLQVIA